MAHSGRVLVVDDQAILLMDVEQTLQAEGYTVRVALDTHSAMTLVHELRPELILIDIRLGDGDGLQLLSEIKLRCPDSIYVVMSAYADTNSAIRAMQTGAHDYLIKPFSREDLSLLVNRSFQRLSLTREKGKVESALVARNAELTAMNQRLRQMVEGITARGKFQQGSDPCPWMLEQFARVMRAEGGSLYLVEGTSLVRRHTLDPHHPVDVIPLPPEAGTVLAQIFETKNPVMVGSIDEKSDVRQSGWSGYTDGSLMSFPLVSGGGIVEGVVNLHNPADPPFLAQDIDLGLIFSSLVLEMLHSFQAYEALHERERHFRALIENSSDLITLVDRNQRIAYDSLSIISILGFDPADRIGHPVIDYVHHDDRTILEQAGSKDSFVIRMMNRQGEWRHMEVGRSDRFDDPAVQGIVLNARDVTERVITERSLKESEVKYRELFDYSPALMFLLSSDKKVLEANQAGRETLGYTQEELKGFPLNKILSAESYALLDSVWSSVIAGEWVDGIELDIVTRTGELRTLASSAGERHLLKDGGRVTGFMAELIDVTELHASRRRELQQREELYQASKLASLGTLLAGVAHEINNPNNFIRMSVDNLKDFWADAIKLIDRIAGPEELISLGGIPYERSRDMVEKMISSIRGGSERIERLVTDLKDFARKGDSVEFRPAVVSQIIDSAVMIVGATIRKSTSNFQVIGPDTELLVNCNLQQIEQVLMNLLTNACHSLETREQGIRIQTVYHKHQPFVDIRVEDEGCGIPEDRIREITDPFFTTRRGDGGTGLGLAISQRIVTDHGGTLVFESTPGEGTQAIVRLPLHTSVYEGTKDNEEESNG